LMEWYVGLLMLYFVRNLFVIVVDKVMFEFFWRCL
jgi:hypothetical protein